LFDDNGNPVSYTYSDNLGSFTFIDLQLGTYNLMAESTGMLTNPYTITLTEANPNAHGIELELYENITEISESEINNTSFKFYPNPVGETLHVLISESRSEEFQLRIYDLVGQLLYSQDVRSVQSSKLANIPMNKFTPGVYLIEVNTLNSAMYNTFKIIKK
jgi:hypothetical protein